MTMSEVADEVQRASLNTCRSDVGSLSECLTVPNKAVVVGCAHEGAWCFYSRRGRFLGAFAALAASILLFAQYSLILKLWAFLAAADLGRLFLVAALRVGLLVLSGVFCPWFVRALSPLRKPARMERISLSISALRA